MRLLAHLFKKLAPFYVTQDDTPPGGAPDGYAPFYMTNLAAPSFMNRSEKDEL